MVYAVRGIHVPEVKRTSALNGGIAMVTEAQKRATAKSEKENVKAFNLRFFPADMDLYEHLKEQPKMAAYLKDLIRRDMESSGDDE